MTPRIDTLRRLQAVLAPLTGQRATGLATVKALAGDTVLPRGSLAAPIITSAAGSAQVYRDRLLVTTADATVTAAGVEVPVASMLGGASYNFADLVGLRWDPPSDGIELVSTTTDALTGGTTAAGEGAVGRVLSYEQLGGRDATAAAFAASAYSDPTIILAWAGSPTIKMTGPSRHLRADRWELYVITARLDGSSERAAEGLAILDAAEGYLLGRGAVDGVVFSAPQCHVISASRVATTPTSYVNGLILETWQGLRRLDPRVDVPFPAGGELAPWRLWNAIKVTITNEGKASVLDAIGQLE